MNWDRWKKGPWDRPLVYDGRYKLRKKCAGPPTGCYWYVLDLGSDGNRIDPDGFAMMGEACKWVEDYAEQQNALH